MYRSHTIFVFLFLSAIFVYAEELEYVWPTDASQLFSSSFAESRGGRDVMARSRTRKLILTDPRYENLFFDLEKDPQELNNLYGTPAYRAEIKAMERILTVWRCKEAKPTTYLNLHAPQIDQPNVPSTDLSHRAAIQRYYRKQMAAWQGRT